MMPISLSASFKDLLRNGKVIALNVGAPPAVSIRIFIGEDRSQFEKIDMGEVPDLDHIAVIGAAVSADGLFVDLVWISEAALTKEVKQ